MTVQGAVRSSQPGEVGRMSRGSSGSGLYWIPGHTAPLSPHWDTEPSAPVDLKPAMPLCRGPSGGDQPGANVTLRRPRPSLPGFAPRVAFSCRSSSSRSSPSPLPSPHTEILPSPRQWCSWDQHRHRQCSQTTCRNGALSALAPSTCFSPHCSRHSVHLPTPHPIFLRDAVFLGMLP